MIIHSINLMWRKGSYQIDSKKHVPFDSLPDEIIINILSQPQMDLKSLTVITTVSKRFYRLGVYVITFNYLRTVQLSILIDQEGHSQFTTAYSFDHFDDKMMSATFSSINPASKRFYLNKEAPTLRHVSIFYQLDRDLKLTGLETLESDENNIGSGKKREKSSSGGKHSKLESLSSKPPTSKKPVIHIRNKKIQGHKQGVHHLLVTRIFPFSNHPVHKINSVYKRQFSWKFSYKITTDNSTKDEYYLTPLQLTIQVNHLIRLESSNENWNKKVKKWMNGLIHS